MTDLKQKLKEVLQLREQYLSVKEDYWDAVHDLENYCSCPSCGAKLVFYLRPDTVCARSVGSIKIRCSRCKFDSGEMAIENAIAFMTRLGREIENGTEN